MQRRWQIPGRLASQILSLSPAPLGTTLPSDFPVIINPYLGVPVLGFGASGVSRTFGRVPVIFLHGNNDTPFPTAAIRSGIPTTLPNIFLTRDTLRASCGVLDIRETNVTSSAIRRTNQALLTARLRQSLCCARSCGP